MWKREEYFEYNSKNEITISKSQGLLQRNDITKIKNATNVKYTKYNRNAYND